MRFFPAKTALFCTLSVILLPGWSLAANPSAEQALKLVPVQSGVDFDRPTADEAAKCKMLAKKIDGRVGWIVETPNGTTLRRFVDTNGDNVVDQWSYYKDGLEVYRDIDINYNGKADQYRWFHTGGSRWALDKNEDGEIDAWKSISAEEVTAEIVAAIAIRDADRFARLVLTPNELKSLGLGKERAENIAEKAAKATAGFKAMSASQKTLARNAAWVQFSAGVPGVVPAGTDQSTKDVRVYENVTAIAESDGQHRQVQIGTLVQVGDLWRAIDLPQPATEGQADSAPEGFFFQASLAMRNEPEGATVGGMTQKLLADLESLDNKAAQATTPAEQAKYTEQRAEVLQRIAAAAKSPDQRDMWIRQLADMLSAAVQSGTYEDGVERLETLYGKLAKNEADKNLAAYVKFRQLTAAYFLAMKAPKADFAKIQADWLNTLEKYIADYPTSLDAAEAMLQLAISEEFNGEEDAAKKWYRKIVGDFPNSPAAQKAAGARTRLDSIGKRIELAGQSPLGSPVDLAGHRGKVVLIQYWATWSAPAKTDMATLKELWNKYGRSFTIIGVNLDNDVEDLNAYLAENPLPWKQIFEKGGMDSRPANVLGILTVPTMILVDQQGKVVNRNVSTVELESELKKLIR
ncbi:MAG: redoxin domain-containing protein [Planctomycetes bacterium]|nr:redoxin domain-containing protein [Planctomycetota bacterium]MCG2685297.1 redoxin domain-containing protein [Planctomycetales bacterium]